VQKETKKELQTVFEFQFEKKKGEKETEEASNTHSYLEMMMTVMVISLYDSQEEL
jgi:hypothetical protein